MFEGRSHKEKAMELSQNEQLMVDIIRNDVTNGIPESIAIENAIADIFDEGRKEYLRGLLARESKKKPKVIKLDTESMLSDAAAHERYHIKRTGTD